MISRKWFGLIAVLGVFALAGCSSGNGGQGNGPAPTTDTVKMIQEKINADPKLQGAKIKVSVTNGMLNFDGTVKSVDQKQQAENDAMNIQSQQKMAMGVNDNLLVEGK